MAEPSSMESRLTCLPCGPVCTVTSVAPSICLANSLTSATDLAMRTPPLSPAEASLNLPLPRPPAWIWLFTTQTGPGSVFAATSASDARRTGTPFEIGTPNSCSSALAWYSWIFIWTLSGPLVRRIWNSLQPFFWYTIYQKKGKSNPPGNLIALVLPGFFRSSPRASFGLGRKGDLSAEQIGRDLLAVVDQALHRADRLVERFTVLAGQFDLDNALDTL